MQRRYSYMTGNDVTYTYGTSGTETGRPVRIVDGSGMCKYKYDKLGNVTDEIRTIALPYSNSEVYRFHMDYTYDSWGRMGAMTYPDGEKITYTYQWGGDLHSMHGNKNGDMSAWYNYNADGDRNFKITSPSLNMRQNAAVLRNDANLKYPTLYASALITFNKGGYTKHYFEGANRICSKIGGGFLLVQWDSITNRVPALAEDYDQQSAWQRENVDVTFGECLGMGVEHERIIDFYDVIKHESELDAPEPTFFYHSDHLGSAAYLSNDEGQVTQILNYLPYGEDWVDIQNYAETRYPRLGQYTFNGKEKDYESGFHYYGARYYWSELLTGWLSVDPMMDKYPSFSSYNYCRWNPVKRVDVDGLFDSEKQAQKTQDRAVKRFGADRVGDVFNKGTAEKPNYSFHVYGPGKDNKTHGESGDNGVWAYKPDATISSNLGLFKYTYLGAERDNKLSVSLTFGGQLEGSLANIGAKPNIGSVDLFGIDVDLDNGLIYTHYADENNAQGSAGVGVGVGVLSAGYSCRYKGGDYYDKGSINHTVGGRVLGAGVGSSAGNIEFGAGAALFFGIDIRLTSTIRK